MQNNATIASHRDQKDVLATNMQKAGFPVQQKPEASRKVMRWFLVAFFMDSALIAKYGES